MAYPLKTCARCGASYTAETHYCAGCGIGLPGKQAGQAAGTDAGSGAMTVVGPPATRRSFHGLMKSRLATGAGFLAAPAGVLATLAFGLRLVYGKSETVLTGFTDLVIFALLPLILGFVLLWRGLGCAAGRKHVWLAGLGPSLKEVSEFLDAHPLVRLLAVSLGSVLMIIGFALALPIAWMVGAPGPLMPAMSRLLPGITSLAAGFLLCRRCLREQ